MDGREGWATLGTHQRRQNEENKKKEKKEDTAYPPLFLSKASVTAAEACLLVLPFS